MPVATDVSAQLYSIAWGGLLVILAFYTGVGVVLRWRPQRTVLVARYEPPRGLSPAIAALLVENGRCERSFAVALVSLATKGFVRINQKDDWFIIEKLRDTDAQVSLEESTVLLALFPRGTKTCSFNSSDSTRLFEAYKDFKSTAQGIATTELISTHVVLWLVGFAYSLTVLEPLLFSAPTLGNGLSMGSIGFMSILIVVGASCFVAALRIWPTTLVKFASLVPGTRGPRRLPNLNDGIPILLTAAAMLGFMFLAILTSTKFASLAAAAIAMNVFSRYLLNAPTSAGPKALAELASFREFLSRTDADRLNRDNTPGNTPRTLEPYTAYAVALGVEHGWGEEFAGDLLEMLQIDQAYSLSAALPLPDESPTVLRLFDRRR
jgi:hypothetical protein